MGRRAKRPPEEIELKTGYRSLEHRNPEGEKISTPVTPQKTLELAASKIEGGKKAFVEYVRMSDNPDAKPFLELWDSQAVYARTRRTLDEYANLSGVRPEVLVSAAASAAYRYNADISDIMAMAAMPRVVQKGIKSATGNSKFAWKDREMLYKHARFIPIPQGSVINVSSTSQASAAANAQAGVMPFSESVSSLSDTVRDAWVPPKENDVQSESD